MAARAIKQLVVKTGEYVDNVSGQTKGRWQRVGTMFKHDDNSVSLKLEAIPINKDWDGWVSVFDMPDNQQQSAAPQQKQAPQQQSAGGFAGGQPPLDDDIPF